MLEDQTFSTLLRRASDHDEQAAAELVRIYEPELRRFIRFRLTDPDLRRFLDSLDICQSVLASFFVHLWAGEVKSAQPRQLMRLLTVMAQNKLRDKVRRHHAERRGGIFLGKAEREPPELIQDDLPEPWQAITGRDLVEAVRERLPEPERQLMDCWMQGEGWDEIAAKIGGSPEALRKRLSRSIDRVAHEIGLIEETP
jgi:RNA polymerase sigma-70 factor (ECF subfamily)